VVAEAAASSAQRPGRDGWTRVEIPIESIDQAATDLLRLGTDAELLEPAELRRRVVQAARDLIRLYEANGPA
jgi:predicted DNA-binding transcriptional regulator YafY